MGVTSITARISLAHLVREKCTASFVQSRQPHNPGVAEGHDGQQQGNDRSPDSIAHVHRTLPFARGVKGLTAKRTARPKESGTNGPTDPPRLRLKYDFLTCNFYR